MKPHAWSIRWWLGGFAAAVTLPLLIVLGFLAYSELRQEEHDARAEALRIAHGVAARIRDTHESSVSLLVRIAARDGIRNFDGKRCDSLFEVAGFLPESASMYLFDPDGGLACSGGNATAGAQTLATEARARAEAVPRTEAGAGPVELIRSIDGTWLSATAIAITDGGDADRGVLAIVQARELVPESVLPRRAVLTILDSEGTVLARSADAQRWSGRNMAGTGVAEVALRRKEGTASGPGIDGVARQWGFTTLPELGWTLAVGITSKDVTEPVRELYVRGAAGAVIALLCVGFIAFARARSLERPINALAKAATMIAAGGSESVDIDEGPSEVLTLATTFNEMVESRTRGERNIRAVSDRLLFVQEEERLRIAREIHDDLGQSLTALKMDVIGLLAMPPNSPAFPAVRARIMHTLDATVTAVQRIASELRPGMLDDLGLVAAIESEARLFEERTAIECEISIPAELPPIDMIISVAIYRIVKEALTNVARHSNATRVEIRMRPHAEELLVEVRDDGRGITRDESADDKSFGLIGIRERAELVGATVQFEGVPGRGTIVSLRIPNGRLHA